MRNKTIPHIKLQTTPPAPSSNQLPPGAAQQMLRGLNELGQATSHLLSGWLGLHPDYARKLLKRLETSGFVTALFADTRKHQRVGSVPPVFVLTARGREYLRRLGISVPKRFKASEQSVNPHRLAENHVLVNARLLERENPTWVRFSAFKHETWFYQHPLKVRLPDGRTVDLKPDLWLKFEGVTSGRYCFFS